MKRFEKLAYLNTLANESLIDNDYNSEVKFHKEFMKVAQVPEGDAGAILKSRVAKGMGLDASVADAELLANIIRICDYIRPERLRDPSQPASPNNVMLRSMAGANRENSYNDEYWQNCSDSFSMVNSSSMMRNFKNKCDYIRKAARSGNINAVIAQFASEE